MPVTAWADDSQSQSALFIFVNFVFLVDKSELRWYRGGLPGACRREYFVLMMDGVFFILIYVIAREPRSGDQSNLPFS